MISYRTGLVPSLGRSRPKRGRCVFGPCPAGPDESDIAGTSHGRTAASNKLKRNGMIRSVCRPLIILFLISGILCSGCSHIFNLKRTDFSKFSDARIPANDRQWLRGSRQSLVSERISREVSAITGRTRRERVYQVMSYVWKTFTYNLRDNERMFSRNADELLQESTLGGCADYALITTTFFRAVEIPARLVITADINWIQAYHENPLSMPEGHVFVEVFLEDRWALVDPTFRKLYSDYPSGLVAYPEDQIFCKRGADYWSMGIHHISNLYQTMAQCATTSRAMEYRQANFVAEPL